MQRSWLCAFLLATAVVAFDAEAARTRAVQPRDPGRCSFAAGPLAEFSYPTILASDGQHLYWVDLFENAILRVPILGGATTQVAPLEEWVPLSMIVDETSVYLGVVPFEILEGPMPGSILVAPKGGGVLATLISGVEWPAQIVADSTHLYWAAVGTLNFPQESLASNGKIERARKSGQERQALAEDLSAPLGLALDGDVLYFGQTGLADDDPTVGVYRVAKTGGPVTTINDETVAAGLSVTDDSIVFWGGDETFDTALFELSKNGSILRTILVDDAIASGPQIVDGRAYYYNEDSETTSIRWIDIEHPADPVTVVEGDLTSESFLADACSVTYSLFAPGEIRRVPRP